MSIFLHQLHQPLFFLLTPLALPVALVELSLYEAVAAEGSSAWQFVGEYVEELFLFEEGVDYVFFVEEDEEVLIAYMDRVLLIYL